MQIFHVITYTMMYVCFNCKVTDDKMPYTERYNISIDIA